MKVLVLMLGLCLGLSAQAADRKIGNVIVVERTLTNVYDNCLKELKTDVTKPAMFFTCVINVTEQPYEVLVGKAYNSYRTDNCSVEGELLAGKLLINFSTQASTSSFEDSKNCLAEALVKKPMPKPLVQTLEIR